MKKLKTAQKEHSKLLRNQVQYESQIGKLKSEVMDMKRNKVRLVQKVCTREFVKLYHYSCNKITMTRIQISRQN